jgi:hypothetical protein
MIRALIMTLLLVVVGGLAGIYIAYGSVDPCRALAVEQTRRASGSVVSRMVEPLTRMSTTQMSSTACTGGLLRSWRDRIVIGAL